MYKSALVGERFGRLVVTEVIDGMYRKCLCDCENETTVLRCNLTTGNTSSCGCFRKEIERIASLKHGHSCGKKRTRVFNIWHGIMERCFNSNTTHWKRYGGRGITVCERWRNSFEAFLEDMGEPPSGYSIDRIDNNGNYEPSNCRWVPEIVQQRNKSSNRLLTYLGETKTLAEWAEITGIPYYTLHARLRRGWSTERTLSTEVLK